ncbi:MAG: Rid family detoxifying hydrolase [Elusimicrobia bacterium]|jgi:2-iminobutanoate/2-iminopropanoate deaminase|nr:Rid family detoxifying hydrolase [Elusimicrobiota bacterium]
MRSILPWLLIPCLLAGCSAGRRYHADDNVIGPYTPVVEAGGFLHVSGQIALKPGTTELVSGGVAAQVRQAMENIKALLAKAGADMDDIVQCTVYLRSMDDFAQMNQVYGSYFAPGRAPARTTVAVARLPRDAAVEVAALAHK